MGYRPRRASIAERVLLTRRKMQEMKEALIPSTANAPKTIASGAKTQFQHEASKYTTGLPRNVSTPMTSQVISKQPLLNGTAAVASSVKLPNVPSVVSPQSFGVADITMEKDVSGSNFTYGARTVDQSDRSYHHTASSSNQNSAQSYSQAEKSLDEKAPSINPVIGSIVMGYQAPSREVSVQKQSIFSNHKAIAKDIEQILHQPVNHPSWTVPSTEYINTRLDCQICKVLVGDVESLLVCDACERGMHLKCLKRYGNQGLPKTEWYCPACVARTKGKSLPPKYGKVTRTIVAPKTSMTSGVTQSSSQVTAESPSTKDSSKKVSANGSVINQFSNEVGSTVREDVMLSLDMTSSKSLSISGAGPEMENTKHDEISSIQKEGTGQPCGDMLTETENSCCEVQSTGASMYGPGNLSGGSHMPTESSDVNSVKGSALQSLSVLNHSDHSFVVSSIEGCKSTGTSHQHPSKKVQMTSTRTLTNEIHQADGVTANGMGTSHKHEKMALDAISDHGNVHQATLNGNICPGHEIEGDLKDGYVGCSTTSSVHWVGDGLKSVDDKTYYNSCSIDGIIYNLHDHILISSEGGTSCPCKLQSLWEEHDSGCRLAMVNPYLFVSDIPESISKPCIDEENEVYGSNNQRIVLVSAIYGPCEVLHIDKFREETKRRCQLDSSGSRLHPIFFCRWTYDESDSSFYKDYNVES